MKKLLLTLLLSTFLLSGCGARDSDSSLPAGTNQPGGSTPDSEQTEPTKQAENVGQAENPKQAEKADVSGIYTDKQGTADVYSQLTLALQADGTYKAEISVYRTAELEGTAVWEEDMLRFTSEDPYVLAEISVIGGKAEVAVITDAAGVLSGEVYSFPDGAPDNLLPETQRSEATAEELLDLFINGKINAIDQTDLTASFYIDDLNMYLYSAGEKVDLDNDGENELVISGPCGGIYLDVRNNKVYKFAEGVDNVLVLSYTYYNGAVWTMYSCRSSAGFEFYHMEKFEGADNLAAEMNFGEELADPDNVEAGFKYTLNGAEISFEEYTELCSKIFAAEVNTSISDGTDKLENLTGEYHYSTDSGTGKLIIEKTFYGYDISDYESEVSYRFLADLSNIETIENNRIYIKYPEQVLSDDTVIFTYYILEYNADEINIYYKRSELEEAEFLYQAIKKKEEG